MKQWALATVLLWALLWTSTSLAQTDVGHKVLGTIGIDAGSQAPAGLYVADRLAIYQSDQLRDRTGHRIPKDVRLNLLANQLGVAGILHFSAISTYLTISMGVPMVHVRVSTDRPEASLDRFGLGDIYVQPLKLGWRLPQLDLVTGYAFYAPTGLFEPGGVGSLGNGHWTHEISAGGAVYFDKNRTITASLLASYNLNTRKHGIDITRGPTIQIQGGAGLRLFKIVVLGAAGYAQWQVRDDRGADLPKALRGARDQAFGLGPELGLLVPPIRSKFVLRYEHDLATKSRPWGQILTIGLTVLALD